MLSAGLLKDLLFPFKLQSGSLDVRVVHVGLLHLAKLRGLHLRGVVFVHDHEWSQQSGSLRLRNRCMLLISTSNDLTAAIGQ